MPHNVTLIPGAGVALPNWYNDTIGDLCNGSRHATNDLGAEAGNRGLADAIIARLG